MKRLEGDDSARDADIADSLEKIRQIERKCSILHDVDYPDVAADYNDRCLGYREKINQKILSE
ncbi:hypothetical protein KY317_01085 [Candidatus Woesearchaeota archaeon]|nr:hypothetical protein [Candidatus Woesearchaeota archaeon]